MTDGAFMNAAAELAQYLISCYERGKMPDLNRQKLVAAASGARHSRALPLPLRLQLSALPNGEVT